MLYIECVSESYRDGNNLKTEYSLFQLFISIKRDVYDDGMFVLKHYIYISYISCCLFKCSAVDVIRLLDLSALDYCLLPFIFRLSNRCTIIMIKK